MIWSTHYLFNTLNTTKYLTPAAEMLFWRGEGPYFSKNNRGHWRRFTWLKTLYKGPADQSLQWLIGSWSWTGANPAINSSQFHFSQLGFTPPPPTQLLTLTLSSQLKVENIVSSFSEKKISYIWLNLEGKKYGKWNMLVSRKSKPKIFVFCRLCVLKFSVLGEYADVIRKPPFSGYSRSES
jgi:hypothetical protein